MANSIIIPATEDELKAYYDLRFEILRKPWGQDRSTTQDEWEHQSIHVLMQDENKKAIATGRLQFISSDTGQVRSMAVAKGYQGKGLGTEVLKFIELKAREKNFTTIILDAREKAVNFYLKNGYAVEGDSYNLFGVIPHFRMKKYL